jgi:hypothetical protein
VDGLNIEILYNEVSYRILFVCPVRNKKLVKLKIRGLEVNIWWADPSCTGRTPLPSSSSFSAICYYIVDEKLKKKKRKTRTGN